MNNLFIIIINSGSAVLKKNRECFVEDDVKPEEKYFYHNGVKTRITLLVNDQIETRSHVYRYVYIYIDINHFNVYIL